ncbi:hypothetical protein [Saccharophagus sp. K07]|uniref:hypothetical protein n=1 Tax=Saccharophagus sp. K07 TaxID=2283636 RepID=UPI00210310AA|nr:hypothetical protein [Saccharophagus sp. K07]
MHTNKSSNRNFRDLFSIKLLQKSPFLALILIFIRPGVELAIAISPVTRTNVFQPDLSQRQNDMECTFHSQTGQSDEIAQTQLTGYFSGQHSFITSHLVRVFSNLRHLVCPRPAETIDYGKF